MAKNKLPPGFSRFEFRPGVAGFPTWGGLDLRSDASASPANTFRVAKNVRLWGQEIIARGGQEKLNSVGIDSVSGVFDTEGEGSEQKLWGFPSSVFVPDPTFNSATWYTQSIPYGDNVGGVAYLAAVGVAGSAKTIRIFRVPKPVVGESNLLYIPTHSGADPFTVRAVGLTSGTEADMSTLGLSYSAGTTTTPPGTPVAEMDASWLGAISPSLWHLIVHYAENGVVWFSAVGDSSEQRLYSVDVNTRTFTYVTSHTFSGSTTPWMIRFFFKFGTQLFALRRTAFLGETYNLIKLPSLDIIPLGSNFTTTYGGVNQLNSTAEYQSNLYIAGHQTTPDRSAVAIIDSSDNVVIQESSAYTSEFVGLAVFNNYLHAIAGTLPVRRWDGATWTSLAAYGGSGSLTGGMPRYFHTDNRMYGLNDLGGVLNIVKRSGVTDLTTAFTNYGTSTWSWVSNPPLYAGHAYLSAIQ